MQEEKDKNSSNEEMNDFNGIGRMSDMLVSFGIGNGYTEIKRSNFLNIAANI
jgi:hypothetical protein